MKRDKFRTKKEIIGNNNKFKIKKNRNEDEKEKNEFLLKRKKNNKGR